MFDSAATFFRQLVQSVRFADLLDVLLVAAFLYAFLTWVRRDTRPGTTWRLAVVLVFFAAVYLLSDIFSMFLVERLLEALLIAFLVASVVLFQSEIRRMIDRIGALSFRQPTASSRGEQMLDTITETAGRLAEEKTGALMAVRGRDSWEGVTQGGVALDGKLSLPLLESIFHEKTPGHDGAVLIEEDRVVRFAAHLPLASELPEASQAGGTRHAAGLGLAEQCDAFVIVVSEERGTISVAENGALVEMESASDLRERLGRFWQEHYTMNPEEQRWWSRRSVQTALLSVFMASLFWLAFAYDPAGLTQRTFDLPVVFENVDPSWMIGEPEPTEVSVSLAGTERAFQLIEPSDLAVSFPLSELEEGANQLQITADNLDLPGGVQLQEASPSEINVMAQRLQSVRLPVRVQSTGTLPDSLRLRVEPDSARLLVPRNGGTDYAAIATESISIDSLRATSPVQLDLIAPEGTRLPQEQRRTVQVRLGPVSREVDGAGG